MLGVHRGGERLRAAGGVFSTSMFCAGRISSKNSLRARAERRQRRRFVGCRGGERPVAIDRLHEAQLAKIARKRRLGHANAHMAELSAQLVLARDWLRREQLQDLALAKSFMSAHVCLCVIMHTTA